VIRRGFRLAVSRGCRVRPTMVFETRDDDKLDAALVA